MVNFFFKADYRWSEVGSSSRLVLIPRLKSSICPTIYALLEGRTDGFMPFLRALAQKEMQTASSRIQCILVSNNIFFSKFN